MTIVSAEFTTAGAGASFSVEPGASLDYSASGTFTGFISLQRSRNGGATWETVVAGAEDTGFSGTVKNESTAQERYRFLAEDTDSETAITGTISVSLGDAPSGAKRVYNAGVLAKAGTSSGWATAAVDALSLATLAASLASKVLIVPITGLKVGDKIVGFHLVGQVESAGNNVVIDAELRKHTAAAGDVADASVAAMAQLTVAADTVLSAANTRRASFTEIVGANETFYVKITGTTLGSTDIALQGVALEIEEA